MKPLLCAVLALISSLGAWAQHPPNTEVQRILERYIEDFRHDPAAASFTGTFLIRVRGEGGGEFTVTAAGKKQGSDTADITLTKEAPAASTWFYTLDVGTLWRLDRREINALTAMGKARTNDPAPMDIDVMPGFQPTPEWTAQVVPLSFHFWTRGLPETVDFGDSYSRNVHGVNMVVLYYQKGLRSAWGLIKKGQRANADPKDQVNSFPSIFIGTRGRAMMLIDGKEAELRAGQMIFVPAGVRHEAWNPNDETAEVILLMFGDGA